MSESPTPMTSARALIEFYGELTEADIPIEIVSDLMRQAAHALMTDGYLNVRRSINA